MMNVLRQISKNAEINCKVLLQTKYFSQLQHQCVSLNYSTKPKTGILMLNMGGPENLDGVQDFLQRLFLDRDLMSLPAQNQLGPLIAKRRTPRIQEQYSKIGGGSPIKHWTSIQGQRMVELLDRISPQTADWLSDGVERAIAFTQYPQYTCSTTGSSLNGIYKYYAQRDAPTNMVWSVIDRWPTHPGLVEVVERGDTYPSEVAATVQRVMEYLNFSHPYRLVWQSKVSNSLSDDGEWQCKVSDSGETNVLTEAGVLFLKTKKKTDITPNFMKTFQVGANIKRSKSLNDSATFIEALADVVKNHLVSGKCVSTQLSLRCPSCININCKNMREFFQSYQPLLEESLKEPKAQASQLS
eukprot:XP_014776607.1 PREDICTED: ferrochelatase, mitochondrial-like [Octopus bimaculoides]